MDTQLHSAERQLMVLKMAHADLHALVDLKAQALPRDDLAVQRLKKQRLALRDQIAHLSLALNPNDCA